MKGILRALAPKLVDVVASSNPVASTVLKMATKKLGLPDNATVEQIEEEIDRNPDKVPLISEVEQQVKMMDIKLEAYKTEVEDRKDAREKNREANDWTPRIFILLCLVLYGGFICMITIMPHDQNDETIISLVLGQLSALLGTGGAYYFGSHQSGKK